MRVAILSARTGWHTDELLRALTERGHTGLILPYEGLTAHLGPRTEATPALASDGQSLDDVDAVLARIIPNGSLEQIIYRVDVLHALEERGMRVMNSARAIERTVDKFYTSEILERAGLATPETVVCERAEQAMEAFRAMGDVIVKPLFGSMGLGMVRVSDEEMAWRVFRAVDAVRGVYYVQRTIAHEGSDVRLFVVGDRVLGAIERRAPSPRAWRTNISRGGEPRAITPSADWCRMALCAARAVSAEYAGVDLMPARDGTTYVLEVNGIPGWSGLQAATGIDVAGAVVEQLASGRGARGAGFARARGEQALSSEAVPGPRAPNPEPRAVPATVQLACLLEVSAPKPGNVAPGLRFHDMEYADFLASAAAIGTPFERVGEQPLGVTIREAIEATAQWTRANTNLGMVLLLAPLARAAALGEQSLRSGVEHVLGETTVDDAREAYRAIRLAAPGGLGPVDTEDVSTDPVVTLREAMTLAAGRDTVAREYASGFRTTFEIGAPALMRARADGLDWSDAIVETYLTLLAAVPDTHIARKLGVEAAAAISRQARAVLDAGGVRTSAGRAAIAQFDAELRDARNTRNPGTTADLTAAAIFVVIQQASGVGHRASDDARRARSDT